LRLIRGADEVPLVDWGTRVLAECEPIAAALDAAAQGRAHRDAIESARARLADPASTPSARVLQAMEREHGNSYVRFVLSQSRRHREAICKLPLAAEVAERFARLAAESRCGNARSRRRTRFRSRSTGRNIWTRPASLSDGSAGVAGRGAGRPMSDGRVRNAVPPTS
jgi:gamma-glutamylcysteine synthetase